MDESDSVMMSDDIVPEDEDEDVFGNDDLASLPSKIPRIDFQKDSNIETIRAVATSYAFLVDQGCGRRCDTEDTLEHFCSESGQEQVEQPDTTEGVHASREEENKDENFADNCANFIGDEVSGGDGYGEISQPLIDPNSPLYDLDNSNLSQYLPPQDDVMNHEMGQDGFELLKTCLKDSLNMQQVQRFLRCNISGHIETIQPNSQSVTQLMNVFNQNDPRPLYKSIGVALIQIANEKIWIGSKNSSENDASSSSVSVASQTDCNSAEETAPKEPLSQENALVKWSDINPSNLEENPGSSLLSSSSSGSSINISPTNRGHLYTLLATVLVNAFREMNNCENEKKGDSRHMLHMCGKVLFNGLFTKQEIQHGNYKGRKSRKNPSQSMQKYDEDKIFCISRFLYWMRSNPTQTIEHFITFDQTCKDMDRGLDPNDFAHFKNDVLVKHASVRRTELEEKKNERKRLLN